MSKMFTIILGQTKEYCGSDYTEKKRVGWVSPEHLSNSVFITGNTKRKQNSARRNNLTLIDVNLFRNKITSKLRKSWLLRKYVHLRVVIILFNFLFSFADYFL